jgi:L-lactate dehydrogenase complex protein LldG
LILERLRAALDATGDVFRGERVDRPDTLMTVAPVTGDGLELAEQFGSKLTEISGTCEIVRDPGEVAERVLARIHDWIPQDGETAIEVLSWTPNEIPVEDLEPRLRDSGVFLMAPTDLHDEQFRSEAAAIDVGITSVDAAFAGTGSVVLASGTGKNRAAALLPLNHIALIPISRIHPTFEAWLHSMRKAGELETFLRDNGQVAFITGPSKTADIELKLTLGVHGPKAIHAIVFDDTA